MPKFTLEQVAQLANASRSAVSRVINNQSGVKQEVRDRILRVITETGYQPNLAARSLASNRSHIIGLVIPRSVQSLFTDPYFPRLIQGIAQACNANDYTISLFLFHTEDEEQKLYPRVLRRGFVDGVIMTSSVVDDPLIRQLAESDMPCVVIGRPVYAPEASYVDVDNVAGAYTAVTHFIRLGHKRIATIAGPQNAIAGIDRRQGYLNALNGRALTIDENLIAQGDFSEIGGYHAMQKLLPHRPTAVFAASDEMAFGAMQAIHEVGLEIPNDMALIGFDDLPRAAIATPGLTTIRQPIRRTGALAVETLIDMVNNGPQPPRRMVLPTELIIRGSCGASSF